MTDKARLSYLCWPECGFSSMVSSHMVTQVCNSKCIRDKANSSWPFLTNLRSIAQFLHDKWISNCISSIHRIVISQNLDNLIFKNCILNLVTVSPTSFKVEILCNNENGFTINLHFSYKYLMFFFTHTQMLIYLILISNFETHIIISRLFLLSRFQYCICALNL